MSEAGTTTERQPVEVAVGVLVRREADGREGEFLLTSRPPGKVYADYWEFPGGKLESGESVEQALRRELQEELGITIGAAHPWRVEHEGQQFSWQQLPVQVQPVLPGTLPVLQWFAAERGFAGATHAG